MLSSYKSLLSCAVIRHYNVVNCWVGWFKHILLTLRQVKNLYKWISISWVGYNKAKIRVVEFLRLSYHTIHMYSGITSGRVLNGELLYTKILEVNLFAFAYRLFHRDFSPVNGAFISYCHAFISVLVLIFLDMSKLFLWGSLARSCCYVGPLWSPTTISIWCIIYHTRYCKSPYCQSKWCLLFKTITYYGLLLYMCLLLQV